jgi:hypothetical protein
MPARAYICDQKDMESLKKLMSYDPFLDKSKTPEQLAELKNNEEETVIFTRQDYWIKDGITLGLDREKCYLVISAVDSFLDKADKKLKESIPSIKRADHDTEAKVIGEIDKERSESEQGLGMIFG